MNHAPPCDEDVLCAKPTSEAAAREPSSRGAQPVLPEPAHTDLEVRNNRLVHILVVEDDIFFRQLNTEVLSHAGYTVDAVEDGAAAWEALNNTGLHYDLLVTDNSMPKVSGVELVRKLHGAHMLLPVIMATGAIPADDLGCQPVAMLVKPYAIAELMRMVKNALGQALPTASSTDQGPAAASNAHRIAELRN